MFDAEKLRAIPIASVATALGFQLSRGMARCRLPGHDDEHPSFSVRSRTNRFNCFACNRGGDAIDLVRIMEGTDFLGACRWLGGRFGIDDTRSEKSSRRGVRTVRDPLPSVTAPAVSTGEVGSDSEIFTWILAQSPLAPSGRAYLDSRGFVPATLAHFGVGQLGEGKALLRAARERFGETRLERCGVMIKGRYGPYLAFRSGYLLFPFVIDGEIVFLQARRPDGERDSRWLCPAHLPPPPFNLEALAGSAPTITICEGVTDVLSAHQLGIPAIGFVGASARIDAPTIARLRGRNVAVLGDADAAGAGFAQRLVRLLGDHGITASTTSMPEGINDLNDFLRAREGIDR
ncbi:MAG: CHC2 zinc finger domain-containing protein [Sphingobium sp.]